MQGKASFTLAFLNDLWSTNFYASQITFLRLDVPALQQVFLRLLAFSASNWILEAQNSIFSVKAAECSVKIGTIEKCIFRC